MSSLCPPVRHLKIALQHGRQMHLPPRLCAAARHSMSYILSATAVVTPYGCPSAMRHASALKVPKTVPNPLG